MRKFVSLLTLLVLSCSFLGCRHTGGFCDCDAHGGTVMYGTPTQDIYLGRAAAQPTTAAPRSAPMPRTQPTAIEVVEGYGDIEIQPSGF